MSSLPDHVAYGTPEAYRQFIAETLAGAAIHANVARTYAEIGNDAGLAFALRCLVACTRTSVSIMADLKTMKAKQVKRQRSQLKPSREEVA
jgi:hypothetical protein